ncbi:MAG: hypothetical protein M3M99_00110, partial [Actinomycetota bacterium]|nr:hypothetical protein [Actinomycetota bacterium]
APARRAVTVASAACQEELVDFGPESFYEDWGSFAECVADYAAYELEPGVGDESGEDEADELI